MEKIKFINHNQNQRIEYDRVLTRYGELEHKNIAALVTSIFGKRNGVIYGGTLEPLAGLNFRLVEDGVWVQKRKANESEIISQNNFIDSLVDTADITNPRYDIVEARFAKNNANEQEADTINEVNGNVLSQDLNIDKRIELELQVLKGTAAASPTPPSRTPAIPAIYINNGNYEANSIDTDLSSPIDLSSVYNLKISIDGGSFLTVDCRGSTPANTTRTEIVGKINTAFSALNNSANGETFDTGNPCKITTASAHGLYTGQSVKITNSTAGEIDGTYTITVVDDNNFTLDGKDNSSGSGGTCDWDFDVAMIEGTNYIKIQSPTNGDSSSIRIIPPASLDASREILGLREEGTYFYKFENIIEWFKIAEIYIPANLTTLTVFHLRGIDKKNEWLDINENDPVYFSYPFAEDHFATNFSIDRKLGFEATAYDQRQQFQDTPFEKEFDEVDHSKTFLHTIETVNNPIDNHLITKSSGWTTNDATSYIFGRALITTTPGSYLEFDFDGVSCFFTLALANVGRFATELSDDDGATWKYYTLQNDGGTEYNRPIEVAKGLPYGKYKARITFISGTQLEVQGWGYATYMNQKSMYQQAIKNGTTITSLDDVSPTTTLLSDNWTYNKYSDSTVWNFLYAYQGNSITGATSEVRLYGSKFWVNLHFAPSYHADIQVEIDSGSGYQVVKTFNLHHSGSIATIPTGFSDWVRLDDGTLNEGWHDIKLTVTTGASEGHLIGGWGWYSSKSNSTLCRSLICGKDSYGIGIDDSGFTYAGGGGWTAQDYSTAYLKRRYFTNSQNDYLEYSIPNDPDIKAIYAIFSDQSNSAANVKIQLGGAKDRYLSNRNTTTGYDQSCKIYLLYDKNHDGDIYNQTLRITHNDPTGGPPRYLYFEGLIIEKGNPVEKDSIRCMPKWTISQGGAVDNFQPTVTNSQRLDVFGKSSDKRPGRRPMVHTGWLYSTDPFYRHGLGFVDVGYAIDGLFAVSNPIETGGSVYFGRRESGTGGVYYQHLSDPPRIVGISRRFDDSLYWQKIFIYPTRVI